MAHRGIEHAEEEEVHQPGDVGLAALVLYRPHDVVVGRGMELHQNLPHHAHARLAAEVHARQLVEIPHYLLVHPREFAALHAGLVLHQVIHPLAEQRVGAAGHRLVGARAIEQLHQQIARDQGRNRIQQHLDGHVEAGIHLAGVVEGQRDDGDVVEPRIVQALADERDVVGCAAPAAGLRDDEGRFAHVVAPARGRFHDLTRHQDGRIADVVVDVLQARIHRAMIHGGQQLQIVTVGLEDGHQQLEMNRAHLRRQNRVGLAHLLGEFRARELSRAHIAIGLELEALRHAGPARSRQLAGLRLEIDLRLVRNGVHARLERGCGGARRTRGRGLLLALPQRRHQAADADAGRAQIGNLVDLQQRVDLAAAFQDFLHLVGGQRVETASEAHHLHQVQIAALRYHPRGIVQARMVHPLVVDAQIALQAAQMRHAVLGEHRHAEPGYKLGQGVVDLRIDMVGTPRQHDAVLVILLQPAQGLLPLRPHGVLEVQIHLPGAFHGLRNLGPRGNGRGVALRLQLLLAPPREVLVEALLQGLLVIVGDEGIQEVRAAGAQLVDVELQRLGVAHDDGAVEVVVGTRILLALPADAGHPDKVRIALEQLHDVPVGELGRIARVLAGHALDARLERGLGTGAGELHAVAQRGEEAVPEGVVLVHVQRTGDAHGAVAGLLQGQHLAVEEQVVLEVEEIGHIGALGLGPRSALAAVAGDEAATAPRFGILAEVVDGEQAVVGALAAAHGAMLDDQLVDLRRREHVRDRSRSAVACQQSRAPRTHEPRDVGTDGIVAGQILERPKHGVVQKRSALHDGMLAQFACITQLDDLEQRVLDDRVGKPGADVGHAGAFFLRLLHAAVHEHGTATPQIDGGPGMQRLLGEVLHGEVQAGGEGLDEATAAGRAALVEHDVLDHSVLHRHALHILPADIQDEIDLRVELACAAQMRHGLYLAAIRLDGLEQKGLAVAGRGGVPDVHERLALGIFGDALLELAEHAACSAQHVAFVVGVKAIEHFAALADKGAFERGGAGIDAQVGLSAVIRQVGLGNRGPSMALAEGCQFLFAREQGIQTRDLAALGIAQICHSPLQLAERHRLLVLLAREGGAARHEEMRVLGDDDGLLGQLERLDEALTQLGQVMERPAQERHVAADGTPAGQAADGLHDHGLQHAGGDVVLLGPLVEQGLHVGFGEDAAAAGDGVDDGMATGHLVEPGSIGVEQRRHLVDEGPGAARASAVHALLDAAVEIDDLRVLAAELDSHVGARNQALDGGLVGNHLLHEGDLQPLREQQSAAAGDVDGGRHVPHLGERLVDNGDDGGTHVGMMTPIHCEERLVRRIQHQKLHRRGPHVHTDAHDIVLLVFHLRFPFPENRCALGRRDALTVQWIRPA